MTTTQHPLTDGAIAGIWTKHASTLGVFTYDGRRPSSDLPVVRHALRAAFDAGREHEREHAAQDRPAEIPDETLDRLVSYISGGTIDCSSEEGRYDSLSEDDARTLVESLWEPMMQAVQAAALAVATPAEPLARTLLAVPDGYGAPHHDADRIKAEDFAMQVDRDGFFIRAGIAHRQDQDGDWQAKDGRLITWAAARAARPDAVTVWPAPTPPPEEVQLPGEPRRLTDVALSGGEKIAEAAWTGAVLLYARHPLATNLVVAPADQIEQWTLDGTRARRDGERPDGEPRFVKESA